jgi:hypothetical protein
LRSTVPSFGRPRNRLGVAQSVCVACLRWPQRQSPAIRCGEDRLPTRGQDTAIGAGAERTRTPHHTRPGGRRNWQLIDFQASRFGTRWAVSVTVTLGLTSRVGCRRRAAADAPTCSPRAATRSSARRAGRRCLEKLDATSDTATTASELIAALVRHSPFVARAPTRSRLPRRLVVARSQKSGGRLWATVT